MRTLFRLAALASLVSGCASYSSFKEARALEPGALQVDVAPGATFTRPRSGATAFLGGQRPSPTDTTEQSRDVGSLELQLRYGLVRGFDLGLKTGLSNLELNGTVELLRGSLLELALAPAIQGALGTNGDDEGWEMAVFKLPVLVGVRFGSDGRNALVLGPTLIKTAGSGTSKNSGYTVDALLAGGTVGFSLEVTKGFRIMPEIAVYTPLAGKGVALQGHVLRVAPDVGPGQPVILQGGLSFSFGQGSTPR